MNPTICVIFGSEQTLIVSKSWFLRRCIFMGEAARRAVAPYFSGLEWIIETSDIGALIKESTNEIEYQRIKLS